MFTILSASLSLLPLATANAWETASGIAGNLIGSVPFLISAPGRYFLANNLTYGNVTGPAITINADEAILDQFRDHEATTTTETEYTFSDGTSIDDTKSSVGLSPKAQIALSTDESRS